MIQGVRIRGSAFDGTSMWCPQFQEKPYVVTQARSWLKRPSRRDKSETLPSPTMAPVQSPLKTASSALCFDFCLLASMSLPLLSRPSIAMDIPLQMFRGSVFSDVSSFVAGRDSPPPQEVTQSALSSIPLPMGLLTYDSSIASAFSVHHPNFDSSSMDDSDFICGGFLSLGPHVYTPKPGVFY
jgi:hypothetical protein